MDFRVEAAYARKGFGKCEWCSEPLDRSPWHVNVGPRHAKVCFACEGTMRGMTVGERLVEVNSCFFPFSP